MTKFKTGQGVGIGLAVFLAAVPVWSQGGAPSLYVELEPLVITAPRLKIPPTLSIDGRINAHLLRLLEEKANARPKEEDFLDPSVKTLNTLSSPIGFQLKTRYTELGFLLTEGLAGTADLVLRNKIIDVARRGTNPQVRAAAMVALAYDKNPADRGLFQEALLSQDITVRFGALEALHIWGRPEAASDIANVARLDGSVPVQVYAASLLLRMGDDSGRDVLIRYRNHSDWMVRAMAIRYIGEFGTVDDFDQILFDLNRETNSFVRSEMAGALLRLFRLKAKPKNP
ncbi:MAG: HEAT repeat domain-containing protein [Elusimicrobia bacterium]|nr:HEAT repeat domain-containing protein [Elusimicrobiota bacterium]